MSRRRISRGFNFANPQEGEGGVFSLDSDFRAVYNRLWDAAIYKSPIKLEFQHPLLGPLFDGEYRPGTDPGVLAVTRDAGPSLYVMNDEDGKRVVLANVGRHVELCLLSTGEVVVLARTQTAMTVTQAGDNRTTTIGVSPLATLLPATAYTTRNAAGEDLVGPRVNAAGTAVITYTANTSVLFENGFGRGFAKKVDAHDETSLKFTFNKGGAGLVKITRTQSSAFAGDIADEVWVEREYNNLPLQAMNEAEAAVRPVAAAAADRFRARRYNVSRSRLPTTAKRRSAATKKKKTKAASLKLRL